MFPLNLGQRHCVLEWRYWRIVDDVWSKRPSLQWAVVGNRPVMLTKSVEGLKEVTAADLREVKPVKCNFEIVAAFTSERKRHFTLSDVDSCLE